MRRIPGVSAGFTGCVRRALAPPEGRSLFVARRVSSVAMSPAVLKRYGVAVGAKYEWTQDPSYRRDFAAEFAPAMGWVDDPATCRP